MNLASSVALCEINHVVVGRMPKSSHAFFINSNYPLSLHNHSMKHIAIFASGTGTNARNIINYFQSNPNVRVECIVVNNPKAKVIDIANETNVPAMMRVRLKMLF